MGVIRASKSFKSPIVRLKKREKICTDHAGSAHHQATAASSISSFGDYRLKAMCSGNPTTMKRINPMARIWLASRRAWTSKCKFNLLIMIVVNTGWQVLNWQVNCVSQNTYCGMSWYIESIMCTLKSTMVDPLNSSYYYSSLSINYSSDKLNLRRACGDLIRFIIVVLISIYIHRWFYSHTLIDSVSLLFFLFW